MQAGISRVVIHKAWADARDEHPRTREMFKECGVQLDEWDGDILQPMGWRRGEPLG